MNDKLKLLVSIFFTITGLIFLSIFLSHVTGSKPEAQYSQKNLSIRMNMTLKDFVLENDLPEDVVYKVMGLPKGGDSDKKINDFNLSHKEIAEKIHRAMALYMEHQSKNFSKIRIKFLLWFVFLAVIFVLIKRGMITPLKRKLLYLSAFIIFGVVFGPDPSPMGTVKDTITFFGINGGVFFPRTVALIIFLFMVFFFNKFICSWGCQLGTLQDFLFRLNRDRKDTRVIVRQFKPPFVIANTLRILFIITLTSAALNFAVDIVEYIDPFKVFRPLRLGVAGAFFTGSILILSIFVYRPWCTMFCPFGLAGWIVEKVSLFKIIVDYNKCVACEACVKVCPSTVMEVILKRGKAIPDCYSCGTCIERCPSGAISFAFGKREKPPAGKFK